MFTSFENCTPISLLPGFTARFIHTDTQTFSLVEVEEGAVLPEHFHENEQFSQVLEGTFELTIGNETRICNPGDVALIESNIPHSGRAITACRIFDVFSPAREDYKKLSIPPEEGSN
ncbi:cupin domain-containing protein [Aureisphaera galaxeae]|uniref:cupin domain-containing protein n=1 Tax=Aureisphaera galaxeae TaxID=1538023 RepID=UPI00235071E7|nr:cupin domain-containing protein [Aureisphaera galaxeae]MDC8003252.1 cupin domain-containing protein [Aureisphaera galaxeae]